ncbi:hypothetical protein ACKKBG_A33980 [Auxenochlorella protothecoides x Auxenochlorella symbiontica]
MVNSRLVGGCSCPDSGRADSSKPSAKAWHTPLPNLANHHPIRFLGSKMGSMHGGLDHMLAAVQEDRAAAANRGNTVASKAGTSRRRGKEPVPVAGPPLDTPPDLASASAEPDTQGLDSATGPHPVDSSSAPAPPLSTPGNPALHL